MRDRLAIKMANLKLINDLQEKLIDESLNEIFVFSVSDLKFQYVNPCAIENLGYSMEELQELTPVDIKPEFDKEKFLDLVSPLISKQVPKFTFKTIHKRKNGSLYDAFVNLQIMEVNNQAAFVAYILDVTELEETSRKLKEQQELKNLQIQALNRLLSFSNNKELNLNQKFQGALEIMFEVPWLKILNKGGVFLRVGEKLHLKHSWNLGEKIETLCETVELGKCLCGRAFAQKETIHASCVDERHEVTFAGISAHGHYNVPIMSGNEVLGVIVLYLSHGHKKLKSEVEFLEACAEVFSQIILTQQYEDFLIQAKAEAEKGEKSKAAFLANMSHEIRTPLNGVIGMAELIKEESQEADTIEKANVIISSGNTLLQIINDILDLSKIEAGKVEVYKEPCSLRDLLFELESLFSIVASKKDLPIKFIMDPELKENVLIDVQKVKQILTNLLNNAVKFTEHGKVIVDVKLENIHSGPALVFEIVDSGLGISTTQLSKLFNKFSQADESTSRRFGGTGLGLAISKNLAELLGGGISVKSRIGKGSTFTLTIPYEKSSDQIKESSSSAIYEEQDFEDYRILLVDDNELNRTVGEKWLKKLGYTPDFAKNGQEAIVMVTHNDYDIILMDCHMPILDGYIATKTIKETLGEESPYIVATTASVMEEDVKKCQAHGMDDFLAKPITKKGLRDVFLRFSQRKFLKKSAS